ncbi:serine hydrolase domain-containing protein [Saccharibacillus sacchari]|uniref:serine hydrolase domain-containing protein n=1 Tax=Saccharibacillus sacchari TaxID=456493 RepID=UPI00055B286A|nr:serine hydrolase domain-containing protein [Saccharibacillus sacchari]
MDAVKHMLTNNKKITRWASLPEHAPAVGWIVRGEKFYWTPNQKSTQDQYEIGSITKTMTALRLAKGEQDGLWQAYDPLAKLVPELADSEFARTVTLRQLATHTSGLTRLAKNHVMLSMKQDKTNPYAAYTEEHLLAAVREEKLRAQSKHEYSNYGYGLLGWALSHASGVPASQAFQQDFFDVLGMNDSVMAILNENPVGKNEAAAMEEPIEAVAGGGAVIQSPNAKIQHGDHQTSLAASSRATLLTGHAPGGRPMPHWDFTSAMAGAGAVHSTLPDMLTYLEAQLGQHPNAAELEPALLDCQHEQASVALSKGVGIGYAWMRSMRQDGTVTHWHNGGTYGFTSYAAFNRDLQSGFVVLSNRGVSFVGQLKQMFGLGELGTDQAAKLVGEALFKA